MISMHIGIIITGFSWSLLSKIYSQYYWQWNIANLTFQVFAHLLRVVIHVIIVMIGNEMKAISLQ